MTPDERPAVPDVTAAGIAMAIATGFGLTIGLAIGAAILTAAWRHLDH